MAENVKPKKIIIKNKLGKTIKAAMPFFAMLGGNAFASSRNQSASLRTRRAAQNTLVYVSDSSNRQKLPNLNSKAEEKQIIPSPFSAFSNNKKPCSHPKSIVNAKVLDFLSNNTLLKSKVTIKANLSGDILGRKLFSHSLPFTLAPGSTYIQSCVNTQYSKFSYSNTSIININTSTGTSGSTNTTTTTQLNCALNNGATVQNASDVVACQALHNACETPSINNPPIINSSALTNVVENNIYSYTFMVSDVNTADTLTLSAPVLPAWLIFNVVTGVLSGTPSNADIGTHNVTLRVNDGTVDVDQNFVITVQSIPIFKNGFEL